MSSMSTSSPLSEMGTLVHANTSSMEQENCYDHNLLTPYVSLLLSIHTVQAVVYFAILMYLFLGIAIIADIFMCAIEAITSKVKVVRLKTGPGENEYEEVEVKIWNETVANLTLMALGSSAPEILLSIIEIVGNNFTSGDLGPGTIVGSAAFNLLIITAVCMVSIPNHETRAIRGIRVFAVTSFFGLFAYIWIFLVLVVVSPNVVEVWEAFLTFFMFILLVVFSYVVDRNFFKAKPARVKQSLELNDVTETDFGNAILGREANSNDRYKSHFRGGKLTKKNLARFIKDVRRVDPSLSDEDAACLAATYIFENETHSRLFYRVSACRQMSGSKAPMPHLSQHLQDVYSLWKHSDPKLKKKDADKDSHGAGDQANGQQQSAVDGNIISMAKTVAAEYADEKNIAVVQFSAPTAIVMENAGKVEVSVRRYGKMDVSFKCIVETLDRTAKAEADYTAVKQEITFAEHEREKVIEIEIIDDKNWNPDKVFLVKLSLGPETDERPDVAKGRMCLMTVTIVDDDEPGTISFTHRLYTVTEADGKAVLPLQREGGADGQILLRYKTVDGSAKNGRDFRGGDGIVIFMHGVTEANIEIPITNDLDEEGDEYFEVVLVSADNGAKIGKLKRAMVTVTNDDEYNSAMGKLLNKVRLNRDNMRLHGEAWREQFLSAVKVTNDDDDDEEGGESRVSAGAYILHCMSFFWKVLFAIIPPVGMWGGWCAFIASLIGIGILTAIVGDVAGTFGCLIGLPKQVNAITFVAMGTSLPDLFASRTAARMENTADNAIGNVTGSNSVNVFLGLGLPWLVASIYWHLKGEVFSVPAGSLGFSVGIFTGVALIATGVLIARRFLPIFGRGELGGPPAASWGCAILFFILWFIYCTLSALQSYHIIAA